MSKAKLPPLVTCTFLEPWRGHNRGDVADLTEERSAELLEDGIVTRGRVPLAKPTKAAAATTNDESKGEGAEELTPAKTTAPKRAPAKKK